MDWYLSVVLLPAQMDGSITEVNAELRWAEDSDQSVITNESMHSKLSRSKPEVIHVDKLKRIAGLLWCRSWVSRTNGRKISPILVPN